MERRMFNVQKTYEVEAVSTEEAFDLMASDIDYDNHPAVKYVDSDVMYVGRA